jgi:hypothetical protein
MRLRLRWGGEGLCRLQRIWLLLRLSYLLMDGQSAGMNDGRNVIAARTGETMDEKMEGSIGAADDHEVETARGGNIGSAVEVEVESGTADATGTEISAVIDAGVGVGGAMRNGMPHRLHVGRYGGAAGLDHRNTESGAEVAAGVRAGGVTGPIIDDEEVGVPGRRTADGANS